MARRAVLKGKVGKDILIIPLGPPVVPRLPRACTVRKPFGGRRVRLYLFHCLPARMASYGGRFERRLQVNTHPARVKTNKRVSPRK